jgi:Ca2+-binding RTX toxin-like protein
MGTGDDHIYAGLDPGSDVFDGGPGSDELDMAMFDDEGEPDAATGPAFVDLMTGEARSPDAGQDTLVLGTIENVQGTGMGDEIYGDDGPNGLGAGYGGKGFVYGRGGNDYLYTGIDGGGTKFDGGPGDDVVYPNGDENSADGGEGSDTISYCLSGGDVVVDLAAGESSNLEGTTTFTSIENAVGCGGDDRLFGDGGDNRLDGGEGSDSIDGREGTDTCLNGEQEANCEA